MPNGDAEFLQAALVDSPWAMIPLKPTALALTVGGVAFAAIAVGVILGRLWVAHRIGGSGPAPAGSAEHDSRAGSRVWTTTAVVLAGGLLVTFFAVMGSLKEVRDEARAEFNRLSERLTDEVARRVNQIVYGLNGARGMYAASSGINRGAFSAYVASRNLPLEFPGALGMGFIERVPRDRVEEFLARERADGAPDFHIRTLAEPGTPLADRPDLWVIKHCFPKARNDLAWGLDIGSEANRREAAEQAARTGLPTITGRIELVQDTKKRAGFLYFVPVYREGVAPVSSDDSAASLLGLLYAPIILDEVLLGFGEVMHDEVDLEIFDGLRAFDSNRLFDLDGHLVGATTEVTASSFHDRLFHAINRVRVGERTWTITTSTTPRFNARIDYSTPIALGLVGTLASGLAAAFAFALTSREQRAAVLARSMTADLAASQAAIATAAARLESIVKGAEVFAWEFCVEEDRFIFVSFDEERLGYPRDEWLRPGFWDSALHPEDRRTTCDECLREIKAGRAHRLQYRMIAADGSVVHISDFVSEPHLIKGRTVVRGVAVDISHRVDAERRVAESEAHLRTIIDAEPNCLKVLDTRGNLLSMNPAGLAILECDTVEEVRELGFDFFLPKEHRRAFYALHDEASRGTIGSLSFDVVGRRGTHRRLESTAVPLRGVSGEIRGVLSVTRDVTAKHAALLELGRQQRLNDEMGAVADVGGWELDLVANRLKWTPQTYRIHELDEQREVNLDSALDFYPPGAREVLARAIDRCIQAGEPWDLELPFVTARGRRIWVRAAGRSDFSEGKATRLYGGFQNITEQVRQREALREQAARLDLTVRSADLGTWDWHVPTGEVAFNETCQTMLGYDPGEWDPRVEQWEKLVHPEDLEHVKQVLGKHLSGESPEYRCEHRLRCKDGSWRWILDVGRVTERDDNGAPVRAMGVHLDVTDRKDMEQRLLASKAAAEAASVAKSAFLANMSHEIRTPLTAIIGFAEMLRDESDSPTGGAPRDDAVRRIINAGNHLLAIINDILDLSKIEADRMTVELVETPLAEVVGDVVAMFAPLASEKGIEIVSRALTPLPEWILCDRTRVRQVLVNLVSNAIKFTDGGLVTIECASTEDAEGSWLSIDVIDTGVGLTSEQVAQLFRSFTQGDSSVTRRYGGTGLGLKICRDLARLMGGSVRVLRTQAGEGTAFRFQVPLRPVEGTAWVESINDRAPCADNSRQEIGASIRGRILLVEDGPDNQRLIAHLLGRAGATVDVAANGRLGLEMIASAESRGVPYDLILTDIQMPEMDGYTMAKELRKRAFTRPIVALTAHALAEDRQRCLDAGCDDHASKPIVRADLLAVCKAWIEQGGLRGETAA
jgi:PAS domain S-box-containing protein